MPGISQGGNLNLPGVALNFATRAFRDHRDFSKQNPLSDPSIQVSLFFESPCSPSARSGEVFPAVGKQSIEKRHALVKIEARRERERERDFNAGFQGPRLK